MKRSISIFLVIILLFNVLGYYGIFLGFKYTNRTQLLKRLDALDYQESETVTIKLPLVMPYGADTHGFERVNGEFEHEDEVYRLVKQQFLNDTLFIVCIKDLRGKQLEETFSEFSKTLTDKPLDAKSATTKLLQNFIKDYIAGSIQIAEKNSGWSKKIEFPLPADTFYQYDFIVVIPHPPNS
jgi:hypothetical protein